MPDWCHVTAVKTIEVSDETYAALQQLAAQAGRAPEEILASLLALSPASAVADEPLAAWMLGPEFRGLAEPERYLALLGWMATRHATEFGEFIRAQSVGRRFLGLTRDEVVEACRQNRARQIAGTQYWAVMNLDATTRHRFLRRVLEFAGYREEVIALAATALASSATPPLARVA